MRALLLTALFIFTHTAQALGPDLDALQMQRLIETSQAQLKAAQELLKQAQRDSTALGRSADLLGQLATGIDQKIQPLQGTATFEQALLRLQREKAGAAAAGSQPVPGETEDEARARQNRAQFQQQSVSAFENDLALQARMNEALAKAAPGFVPRISAQAELGQWQTNTRISAQLSELLAAIEGLRRDLRGEGRTEPQGFGLFLSGSAEQSRKLQGGSTNVP